MNKPKIIKDYVKLSPEIVELIIQKYPNGYRKDLITFLNKDGKINKGLPFETEDFYYLIRMNNEKLQDDVSFKEDTNDNLDEFENDDLDELENDKLDNKYDKENNNHEFENMTDEDDDY